MPDITRSLFTRRSFLKATTSALALTGLSNVSARAQEKSVSPINRITLGFIGVGGRGLALIDNFKSQPDVDIAAVCDVYEPAIQAAIGKTDGKAQGYADFRKVLERKDIDAVVIATPPHWHPIISIMACQAGKDVFCEKPISLHPTEARAMLKAAKVNKRVTQVGTQIHSYSNFRRAVEVVQSGMLGKISHVRVICTMNQYPEGCGKSANGNPPSGLDWDMWLGPAPQALYNDARFKNNRFFRDYMGSLIHDFGPHIMDLPFWALNPGEPKSITGMSGKFVADDIGEIPDTQDIVWNFGDFTMSWMHSRCSNYTFGFGGPSVDPTMEAYISSKAASFSSVVSAARNLASAAR